MKIFDFFRKPIDLINIRFNITNSEKFTGTRTMMIKERIDEVGFEKVINDLRKCKGLKIKKKDIEKLKIDIGIKNGIKNLLC